MKRRMEEANRAMTEAEQLNQLAIEAEKYKWYGPFWRFTVKYLAPVVIVMILLGAGL